MGWVGLCVGWNQTDPNVDRHNSLTFQFCLREYGEWQSSNDKARHCPKPAHHKEFVLKQKIAQWEWSRVSQVSCTYYLTSGMGWRCCFVPPLRLKLLFVCPEIQFCNAHRREFSALIILPIVINLAQNINIELYSYYYHSAQGTPDSTKNNAI